MKFLKVQISKQLVDSGGLEATKEIVNKALEKFFAEYDSMPDEIELVTDVVGTK